jgi:alanine dehydrogenase
MIIGVLKEIKKDENRVSLIPVGAEVLTQRGHQVLVEKNAGENSGFPDSLYAQSGAKVGLSAEEVYEQADMILKVKEPLESEWALIRKGQIVFTYFHFAASEELTRAIMHSGCSAVAYETIETPDRKLPLLTPMSEVAGKMAVQQAAKYLEREHGGRGVLIGGVPGVEPATVMVLGAGVVGTCAAKVAAALGAQVYVLDINLERLRYLDDIMPPNVHTIMSNPENIRRPGSKVADIIIGGVC